jgi:hypothetical protein
MTDAHDAGLDIGHPAPQRHKIQPAELLFALVGGPVGWLGQLLFAFASTSYFCAAGMADAVPGWLWPAIALLNLGGLTLAAAALLTALALVRRTAQEHRGRSGGVMDAGEGRTRFLAVWGLFISAVFIVATLANSFSLILVPLCRA